MAHRLKIAEHDEVPPGRGKTLRMEGLEVTIMNDEGRYVATATRTRVLTQPPFETTCEMPGHHFDVNLESSPGRIRADVFHYAVEVAPDGLYVVVEDHT